MLDGSRTTALEFFSIQGDSKSKKRDLSCISHGHSLSHYTESVDPEIYPQFSPNDLWAALLPIRFFGCKDRGGGKSLALSSHCEDSRFQPNFYAVPNNGPTNLKFQPIWNHT